jgi:small-conductance mechanosensitive channel
MEGNSEQAPVSVKDWIITMVITAIPMVGFIMLFVWAFSDSTHPSKKNWAKASLIFFAIIIGLYIMMIAVFGSLMVSAAMFGD